MGRGSAMSRLDPAEFRRAAARGAIPIADCAPHRRENDKQVRRKPAIDF
jgi:hypothetical protein